MYYHISENKKLKYLTPRIPETALSQFEDIKKERICACDNIDGCLSAIMPCSSKKKKYYVYRLITNEKPYKPKIYELGDVKETGEVWFFNKCEVELVKIICNVKEVSVKKCKNYKHRSFHLHVYSYDDYIEK